MTRVEKSESNKNDLSKKNSIGRIHIYAGFNNTKITISDLSGNVIAWSSSGKMKFTGSRKGTPFAAQVAAEDVIKNLSNKSIIKNFIVYIAGPGAGRESAVKCLQSSDITIISLSDITPIPHGGCRPKKRRRI